jgi:hypothetical protein
MLVNALRHSLEMYGFAVEPESRGGVAESGARTSLGHRDWLIRHGSSALAIGEAFRINASRFGSEAKRAAKAHIGKLMKRYNPTLIGPLFVVIWNEAMEHDELIVAYRQFLETCDDETIRATGVVTRSEEILQRNPAVLRSRHRAENRTIELCHCVATLSVGIDRAEPL